MGSSAEPLKQDPRVNGDVTVAVAPCLGRSALRNELKRFAILGDAAAWHRACRRQVDSGS